MKSESDIASDLAPSSLQALCPAGVIITRVSLEFTAAATEEAERFVDGLLDEVGGSHLYQIGDYLNYLHKTKGEEVTRKRIERSYAPETVRGAMWMTKRVTTERRLLSPGYTHSLAVASLKPTEQEHWLTQARENAWTVKQLRTQLRQRQAIGKGAPSQAPADPAAATASEAFEVFRAWYQAHAPAFTSEQKAEWDEALCPLVTDHVAHLEPADFERLCGARQAFLEG